MLDLKKVKDPFREYCDTAFGEKTDTCQLVYKTYKSLTYPNTDPKHKYTLLSTRRISNIQYFINTFGPSRFIEGVQYYHIQKDKGLIKTNTLNYFTTVVENFLTKPTTTSYTPKPVITNTVTTAVTRSNIVPKKFTKVRSEYDNDFYNWNYLCTCGHVTDPWAQECQQCGAYFLWEQVP